jgi:hypothetical protein
MTRLALIALLCSCVGTVTEPEPEHECDTSDDCGAVVCCVTDGVRECLPAGDCAPDGEPTPADHD